MFRILLALVMALMLMGADRVILTVEYPSTRILKLAANKAELEGVKPRDTLLVAFGGAYCSPCKVEAPYVQEYAKGYNWAYVYIDDDGSTEIQRLMREHKVKGLPTYIVFHKGQEVYRGAKRDYKTNASSEEIQARVRLALHRAHQHIN